MFKYLNPILNSLVPSVCIFLGRNSTLFSYCADHDILKITNENIESIQTVIFFLGIFWVGIVYPIKFVRMKKREEVLNSVHSSLIEYNKKLLFKITLNTYKSLDVKFNTRIFVPKKGFFTWFKDGIVLEPKFYEGLTDRLEDGKLTFEVNNKGVQGMVGKSFKEKKIFMDFDMSDQNKYQLTEVQKRLVRNVKFCSTIPILDHNSNIIAVLSVDSNKVLRYNSKIEDAWKTHLIEYASFIAKNVKI